MSEKQVLKRQTLCTTLLKNRIISNAYLLRALFLLQLHLRLFINSIKNPHENNTMRKLLFYDECNVK